MDKHILDRCVEYLTELDDAQATSLRCDLIAFVHEYFENNPQCTKKETWEDFLVWASDFLSPHNCHMYSKASRIDLTLTIRCNDDYSKSYGVYCVGGTLEYIHSENFCFEQYQGTVRQCLEAFYDCYPELRRAYQGKLKTEFLDDLSPIVPGKLISVPRENPPMDALMLESRLKKLEYEVATKNSMTSFLNEFTSNLSHRVNKVESKMGDISAQQSGMDRAADEMIKDLRSKQSEIVNVLQDVNRELEKIKAGQSRQAQSINGADREIKSINNQIARLSAVKKDK